MLNFVTLLYVISSLYQNQLLCTSLFSEVNKVKECGFCEFVDSNFSKPYVEPLSLLIIGTWEVPEALRAIKSYSRIEIEELSWVLFHLEKFLKSLRLIYNREWVLGQVTVVVDSFVSWSWIIRWDLMSNRRCQLLEWPFLNHWFAVLWLVPYICLAYKEGIWVSKYTVTMRWMLPVCRGDECVLNNWFLHILKCLKTFVYIIIISRYNILF